MEEQEPTLQPRGQFGSTRWTMVLAAATAGDTEKGRMALADLCGIYWYPLYCYVRRSGYEQPDAEDLTQGFFAQLLGKNYLGAVAREKGRFRSFLLTAIKHFLANEWDRSQALKRGGGVVISLDVDRAESLHPMELAHGLSPEKIFERQWVLALLDRVLVQLRDECVAGKKEKQFDRLKVFLTGDAPPNATAALAGEMGVSEGSLKVAIHRLRRRYRELLRTEIAQTVERPEEVDDEIHRLFSAFA